MPDQIEIYVRSSPLGSVGIHWRNVSKPEQLKEDPEILMEQVVPDGDSKISVNSAISDKNPCLILAKYNGKVFLEVTGIDATPDRSEKLGRRISEVVLWVGDDNKETEERLRKLAYCALLGLWDLESKFRTTISSSIEFDGLNDYKVKADDLNKIYEDPENHTENLELEDSSHPNQNYLECNKFKTDKEVVQIATQLRKGSFDGMETAVVISEIKQTESERWLNHRGNVASLTAKPEVIEQKVKEDSFSEAIDGSAGRSEPKKKTSSHPPKRGVVALLLIISLIILLMILWAARTQVFNILQSQSDSQSVPTMMQNE